MIRINNLNIWRIYLKDKDIKAVYRGTKLIWNKDNSNNLSCCFANGYWDDQYPWQDDFLWSD